MERVIKLIPLIAFFYLMYFYRQVLKDNKKSNQLDQSNSPLTNIEKTTAWILCVINPVLAGAVMYYGWKKELPTKAKEANQISMKAFLVTLLIGIGLFYLTNSNGVTTSETAVIHYTSEEMSFRVDFPNTPEIKSQSTEDFDGKYYSSARLLENGVIAYVLDEIKIKNEELITSEEITKEVLLLYVYSSIGSKAKLITSGNTTIDNNSGYSYKYYMEEEELYALGNVFLTEQNKIYNMLLIYESAFDPISEEKFEEFKNSFSLIN